jgi:long-chain acyl-CoA synthetase
MDTVEPRNLYELLKRQADVHGRRVFLRAPDRAWTYRDCLAEVDALSAGLAARGVKAGDAFGISLRNNPEFVLTSFALSRLGAAAVPLNFLVTKSAELVYMLRDAAAVGILTEKEFLPQFERARAELPGVRLWLGVDVAPAGGERLADVAASGRAAVESLGPSVPDRDDTASIIYTSGTTGNPKGVELTHGNFLSNSAGAAAITGACPSDVALAILPLFHTAGWTGLVLTGLNAGAEVVLVRSITPPSYWLKQMALRGVTGFVAVPQIYSVLVKEAKGLRGLFLRYVAFRKVRLCISSAAPLTIETWSAFKRAFGLGIVECYGSTETSPGITSSDPAAPRPGWVGAPFPGVLLKIVDEDEKEAPEGAPGEVCVQGPNVMKGYHGNPEATREAFTRDGRWLKTGDIGLLEKGQLKICDRKKDMVIVKGLKVFPAQIEQVIAEHPAVFESAVIGLPHSDGEEIMKAFVVLRPGMPADASDLFQFLKSRLDPYKRPREIEIVAALPKNALQKVLKRELRRMELEKRERAGSSR